MAVNSLDGDAVATLPDLDARCHRVPPARAVPDLLNDVRAGLLASPRELPPKYFYDERGSILFDRICDSREYYPMRTESALLERHAADIVAAMRPRAILELGSGTSRKTRHLLDACDRLGCHARYVPFDVCREIVVDSGRTLLEHYDWLDIAPLVGDYMAGLDHLPEQESPTLFVFLGGTIGNFTPEEAGRFLADVRALMRPADRLLIGADRIKDPALLHAAYNDAGGITADFNLNVLRVLNRDLGAEFDVEGFAHYACFNPGRSRIEMYLVAMQDQQVRVPALDCDLSFAEGDEILTEISRKFTRRSLEGLLADGGFSVDTHFQADDGWFSLVLARPGDAPA